MSWNEAELGSLVKSCHSGFACGTKDAPKGVSHLRMNNIGIECNLVLDLIRTVPPEKAKASYILEKGDVLVCTTNSGKLVGKTAHFDLAGKYAFSNHLTRLKPDDKKVDGRFLAYYLWLHWKQGGYDDKCKNWVNQSTLPKEELLATEIPLPPLEEQHRIADKLDILLAKVNKCKSRLERIPEILKRFRQSVLADACSGKLTEDWREENGTEEWSNVSLVQLIPKGGIFDGPFGSNLKTSDYTSKGVRVVRLENIGHLAFISEKETFISKEKYESLKKHTVHEGDIIFSSFISESIRVCMLPKLSTAAIAKADCFCIRPLANRVLRDYLLLQLACSHTYNQLVEQIHGATRPRINTTQLKALKVRVCAIDEQREIVSRVNRLFAIADSAEEHHAKAKARVEQISQSVLSMAFRGELLQS